MPKRPRNDIVPPTTWPESFAAKPKAAEARITRADNLRVEIIHLYRPLVEKYNTPPAPSLYADYRIWHYWQEQETAILCLRPSKRQSLPLSTLDPVFHEFEANLTNGLSNTPAGAAGLRIAWKLCNTMGNHFASERKRGKKFEECIDQFFGTEPWQNEYAIGDGKGRVNSCLVVGSIHHIFREDKVELGDGHDAYMQICRDYQIYVESLGDDAKRRGAPAFLLLVVGPMLIVAGGVWDGKSVIVEPLAQPCLMLADHSRKRQQDWACQLLAVQKGVDMLKSRQGQPVEEIPAGVPRIYRSFQSESGEKTTLHLHRRLHVSGADPLVFIADTTSKCEDRLLVKLVYENDRQYGKDVHDVLAKAGLAPALHGSICIPGAPTAYIMEYLKPPSSPAGGWITLYEFAQKNAHRQEMTEGWGRIWQALDKILIVMEQNCVVHSDLRASNIMVKVAGSSGLLPEGAVALKVIDFDWGGALSDERRYPLLRNTNLQWPGNEGDLIKVEHDRALVEGWYARYLPDGVSD